MPARLRQWPIRPLQPGDPRVGFLRQEEQRFSWTGSTRRHFAARCPGVLHVCVVCMLVHHVLVSLHACNHTPQHTQNSRACASIGRPSFIRVLVSSRRLRAQHAGRVAAAVVRAMEVEEEADDDDDEVLLVKTVEEEEEEAAAVGSLSSTAPPPPPQQQQRMEPLQRRPTAIPAAIISTAVAAAIATPMRAPNGRLVHLKWHYTDTRALHNNNFKTDRTGRRVGKRCRPCAPARSHQYALVRLSRTISLERIYAGIGAVVWL